MPRRLALVALPLLLAASAPAEAARQKPIRGKLTAPGYTLVALSTSGKVTTKRVKSDRFSLRPPADVVTLHLRARGGFYAGPIVVGTRKGGRRTVLGVRAGARLGKINVRPNDGFARTATKPPRRVTDRRRIGRARKGVPIGAGVFGWVRSKPPRRPPEGDRDFDGIPDRLDIDDDGDRVLDKVDRSGLRRGRATAVTAEDPLGLATGLGATLSMTPNVHTGASDAEIDQASRDLGYIIMDIRFGVSAVELDCGPPVPAGLSYCALGGTAVHENGKPFPECCDGDGDGFGTMVPTEVEPGEGGYQNFAFDHRSTSAQIGTGYYLFQHVTKSGDESQCPSDTNPNCVSYSAVQQFAFTTIPALKSFDDGPRPRVTIPYPVGFNEPGNTANNPLPVSARSGGEVILDLTFWRPQRRPTSDAECGSVPGCALTDWRDMGGLVHFATGGPSDRHWASVCPKEGAYSDPSEGLQPFELEPGESGGFLDTTATRAADPAHTLSYRLNLTKCLDKEGISFGMNQTRGFAFQTSTPTGAGGLTGTDTASQVIYFRRTG
jgi:hypothetical protein